MIHVTLRCCFTLLKWLRNINQPLPPPWFMGEKGDNHHVVEFGEHQSTNQSTNQSIDKSTYQSTYQSTNQSINQAINPSIDYWFCYVEICRCLRPAVVCCVSHFGLGCTCNTQSLGYGESAVRVEIPALNQARNEKCQSDIPFILSGS